MFWKTLNSTLAQCQEGLDFCPGGFRLCPEGLISHQWPATALGKLPSLTWPNQISGPIRAHCCQVLRYKLVCYHTVSPQLNHDHFNFVMHLLTQQIKRVSILAGMAPFLSFRQAVLGPDHPNFGMWKAGVGYVQNSLESVSTVVGCV